MGSKIEDGDLVRVKKRPEGCNLCCKGGNVCMTIANIGYWRGGCYWYLKETPHGTISCMEVRERDLKKVRLSKKIIAEFL